MSNHPNETIKVVGKQHKTVGSDLFNMKLSRHCLATLIVDDDAKLYDSEGFKKAVSQILAKENVVYLGDVTHNFDNNSYTIAIALAESHISVHTWPERFAVQLDVFLCNYINDNTEKCERIFDGIVDYFGATEVDRVYINRL